MAAEHVDTVGKVETHARLDGRNMTMVLAPDKKAQAAAEAATSGPDRPIEHRRHRRHTGRAPTRPAARAPTRLTRAEVMRPQPTSSSAGADPA